MDVPPEQYAEAYIQAITVNDQLKVLVDRTRQSLDERAVPEWLEAELAELATRGMAWPLLVAAIMELAVQSAPAPPAPITIYAVRYSNYEPPEIEAMYLTEQAAQAHADRLNNGPFGSGYQVCTWTVHPDYDPDRKEG